MEDLIEHVQQYLDTDPRFFNLTDGEFEWGEDTVYFRKTNDEIFLFLNGVVYTAVRN